MNWNPSKVLIYLKRLYRAQKRSIICLVAICLFCIIFYTNHKKTRIHIEHVNKIAQMQLAMNLQNETGSGCVLPKLNPFSEEALAYSKKMTNLSPIVCDGPDWVTCDKAKCFVIDEILQSHKNIVCNYMDIIYVSDNFRYMDKPIPVKDNGKYALKRSDHVEVICTGVENENSKTLSSWHGYKAGFRPIPLTERSPERNDSFNVLMLAIDSASHNGFIRGMPKSYKYLKEKIKAVFLNGHNVVGDGTPAALFPILTGLGEFQQPEYIMKGLGKHIETKNFIFHHAKNDGYRTAYFEDMPQVGTFQYRFNGFNKLPADHYLQPVLIEEFNNRTFRYGKHMHCIGDTPSYQYLLNLTAQFMQLDRMKFCLTLLVDLAHDDFNLISNGDNDILKFLKMVVDKKLLEDTLLIVMGDHGSRYEGIRNTHQGRIEERLPLMAITLPERLKQQRPETQEALEHNKDMLTTHFDIHSTLLDILDLTEYSNMETIPGASVPRAISLLEKIPKTRTCSEAGIVPHWCVCVKWNNVPQSSDKFQLVGKVFTDYINAYTDDRRDICAKRELISVEWVLKQSSNEMMLRYQLSPMETFLGNLDERLVKVDFEYYQAKIVTSPGEAIYEGTLTYNVNTEFFHILASEISRIDLYGNESACISNTEPYLNKFCYCTEKSLKKEIDEYMLYVP